MAQTPPLSGSAQERAETLVTLCGGGHKTKEGWMVCCPAHKDSTPSLSIAVKNDKVLLKCFGGCANAAIIQAMGITFADLTAQSKDRPSRHRRIVKVYDYYDSSGALVHQTVRYEPKWFNQRRPDPGNPGQYIWNLHTIEPVLYHLPAVLQAVAEGVVVYLVEGEKDADLLEAYGFVATCNPMGAGKWQRTYSAVLRDAHVTVLADHDTVGARHAEAVARTLLRSAATVKLIDTFHTDIPGSDISDWFAAGGTRDEFEAIVSAAPRYEMPREESASRPYDKGQPPTQADTQPTTRTLDQRALVDLLLQYPEMQPALQRDSHTEDTMHDDYDELLAEVGVRATWDETMIVALIHEANARSGRPPPPDTLCMLMIQKARLRTKTGNLEQARAQLLGHLSTIWGLRIAMVIRHGIENSLWHLELDDGREIHLGSSKDLLTQAQVRVKIFDVTGRTIKRYSARESHLWDHHIELLALAAIVIDTPEMTTFGQAKALVTGYLETQYCPLDQDTSSEEWEGLALANKPFIRNNMLFLSVKHLWLAHVRIVAPKMEQGNLLDMLRLLGGHRKTITIMHPKKTSRSLWLVSPLVFLDTETSDDTLTTLTLRNSEETTSV